MNKIKKMNVSVITPFFDESEEILNRNVKSVSESIEWGNMEGEVEQIIVVDTNDYCKIQIARQIMDRYDHAFVLENSCNMGLPFSRNNGIKNSSGEYIMLLDSDDMFSKGKIRYQIDFMRQNNLDHSCGGYREIHGDKPPYTEKLEQILPPVFDRNYLYQMNNICYCGSNCFKRNLIKKIGYFDEKLTGIGAEDLEYWIRIAKSGAKMASIQKVLYYLGVHSNNMTGRYTREGRFEKAFAYIKEKHNL